jgi:hypothetical protein
MPRRLHAPHDVVLEVEAPSAYSPLGTPRCARLVACMPRQYVEVEPEAPSAYSPANKLITSPACPRGALRGHAVILEGACRQAEVEAPSAPSQGRGAPTATMLVVGWWPEIASTAHTPQLILAGMPQRIESVPRA